MSFAIFPYLDPIKTRSKLPNDRDRLSLPPGDKMSRSYIAHVAFCAARAAESRNTPPHGRPRAAQRKIKRVGGKKFRSTRITRTISDWPILLPFTMVLVCVYTSTLPHTHTRINTAGVLQNFGDIIAQRPRSIAAVRACPSFLTLIIGASRGDAV